jgi:putative acetyltransferase
LGIHAVHAQSFPSPGEARLVDLLRGAGRLAVSLVAEVDGAVVGHVAVSAVTVASGPVGGGIGPVAVVAGHRRRAVAAELMDAALRACPATGFGWAVVLGDPAYLRPIRVPPRSRVRPVGRVPRRFGISGDRTGAGTLPRDGECG